MLTGQGAVDSGSRNLADGQKIAIERSRPLKPMGTNGHQWTLVAKEEHREVISTLSSTVAPVPALPKATWKPLMLGYLGISASQRLMALGVQGKVANKWVSSNRQSPKP